MNNQNNKKENKLINKKNCTINSIKEIEFFLCNLNKGIKSFKIINFFKNN